MDILSRQYAIKHNLLYYFTGKPCPKGHICQRRVINCSCTECEQAYHRTSEYKQKAWERQQTLEYKERRRQQRMEPSYRKERNEKEKEYNKRPEVKERKRKYGKEYYTNNKEEIREYHRKRYIRLKDKINKYQKSEKVRKRTNECKRKYKLTPLGQLRSFCSRTTRRLNTKKFSNSKLKYLDYKTKDFVNHLLSNFPQFETLQDAFKAGYEIDHIIPLAYIVSLEITDELKFKTAMDLDNLRLITDTSNREKSNRTDLPEVQETLIKLSGKYNFTIPSPL